MGNLDWFPRMRAMSLTTEQAGESQEEGRALQELLASTLLHVETLSNQLDDLKKQV